MDRGAWQATVHGDAQSWTALGDLVQGRTSKLVSRGVLLVSFLNMWLAAHGYITEHIY